MSQRAATPDEVEAAVRRQPPLHALLTRDECAGILHIGVKAFDGLGVPAISLSGKVNLYQWQDVLARLERRKGNPVRLHDAA